MQAKSGVLIALIGCSILGGCAGGPNYLEPDNSAYAGLPPEVVKERVVDPVLIDALENGFSPEERTSVIQLNVSYAVFCRDLYDVYQNWTLAGVPPVVPAVVVPVNPSAMFPLETEIWVDTATAAIASNDPSVLRRELLLDGGCRDFVVDPTASSSMTVADALAG